MGVKFNPFTGNLDLVGAAAGGGISALNLKGTVSEFGGLAEIVAPDEGDVYQTEDTGIFYVWDGATWASIGTLQGAQGQQGPAGAAGVNGADGTDGIDGADGLSVLSGAGAPDAGLGVDGEFYIDTVATAIYGPKTAGAWGSPTSLIGADGAPGVNGTDGAPGTNGADGAPGADGIDGRTILSGTVDPTTEGENGDFYINTSSSTLFGPKATGTWPSGVLLIGADGADGADGAPGAAGANGIDGRTILNGSGAPDSGLGVDGDFYIDTTADAIYGPKTAGAWGSPTSLIGPAGADGVGVPTGGATGQVLAKASATDYDTEWVNQSGGGSGTDLAYDAATRVLSSSTGTDATLPLAAPAAAGLQPATGYGAITYASTIDLDGAVRNGQMNTISLTGTLEFTTSSLANGQEIRLRLIADGTTRALTFPADWKFLSEKPDNITASKEAILSLAVFGTTNADVRAVYLEQP
jgi:hypothetical protein